MERSDSVLSEKINDPKDYLSYSKEVLLSAGVLTAYPKLFTYYQELCVGFDDIYYDRTKNLFDTFRALLAVDAQIQILLELVTNTKTDLCQELGMKEEEIISMIKHDKRYYYRELTGHATNQLPKWGLIYLSEE
ncbi:hypothetical protein ACFC85_14850 [Enterococcus casseliflavus]